MKPFTFEKSLTLQQALANKNTAASFIAGGTNLVDLMKKAIALPDNLLDITTVLPADVQLQNNTLTLGAMVRNSTLATNADIQSQFSLVAKAVLAGASPQIRNMASTGGNLLQRTRCPYFYDVTLPCNKRVPGSGCSAFTGNNRTHAIVGWSEHCVAVHPSDLCVALAALDAIVIILDKNQMQSKIPFKDFHRLPDQQSQQDNNLPANSIIHSIEIPANGFGKNNSYIKLRDRDSYAFALVSVAAALALDGNKIKEARLASGGVAHKPWRWYAAEDFLKGKVANEANFSKAADIVIKETKPLEHNKYKATLLFGAVTEALKNCITT